MEFRINASLSAAAVVFGLPALANATIIIPPAGLAPGSTYRLIFTSSGLTPATSSLESDYNAFGAAQAALNGSLPIATWYAITSTSSISAATNIAACGACTDDPIYRVDGVEVAANQAALFGTLNMPLLSPISVDQFGNNVPGSYVWTGTAWNGSILGPLGSSFPYFGGQPSTDTFAFEDRFFLPSTVSLPIYVISGELTVPGSTTVPEPSSASILLAGGALTGLAKRLKRRRRKAA